MLDVFYKITKKGKKGEKVSIKWYTVKPKIIHRFINYFDYMLHIIASNLLYFIYFFQVRHNKIKMRKQDVEAPILHDLLKRRSNK